MSNEIMLAIPEVSTLAASVAKSGMINGITTTEQAFTLMMICQADGIHPMKALQRYHIIEGRPSWKSNALLAAFKERGGKCTFSCRTNEKVEATFMGSDGEKITVEWTIEMAQAAGLTGKKNWKYPRQMLTARVISEGVNIADPGIMGGFYTAEETQDIINQEIDEGTFKPQKPKRSRSKAKTQEIDPEIVQPGETAVEEPQVAPAPILEQVLEEIEQAKNAAALDDLVKAKYKISIQGMAEEDRKKAQQAYLDRRKTLVFSNVPGNGLSDESSEQVLNNLTSAIQNSPNRQHMITEVNALVEASLDQMTPADQERLKDEVEAKMLTLNKAEADEKTTPKTEVVQEPEKPAETSEKPQEKVDEKQEAIPEPSTLQESDRIYNEILASINGATTRAALKQNLDLLDEYAKKLTPASTKRLEDAYNAKSAELNGKVPQTPKAPEGARAAAQQTTLPGTEPAPKTKAVYGPNDKVPEWCANGAEVQVSATPGGKPYMSTTIDGAPYMDDRAKQWCVKVKNVNTGIPVACIKPKEA